MLIWTVTVSPREISTLATLFLYTEMLLLIVNNANNKALDTKCFVKSFILCNIKQTTVRSLFHLQNNSKCRSNAFPAFYLNLSIIPFHNEPDHRQPKPGAGNTLGTRWIYPEKWFKNV